ncbi:MAG TPA: TetR/AcrR family transcriptional regulator [Stellaceae bacterium]|nr:TetR/AcrR family transcriptional regulator [Stellaceae bacterium]
MSTAPATSKKTEQSQRTRRKLLKVAQRKFAALGYAGTALEDVAAAAGVTTGAVYHLFRDKKALFHAVAAALEAEIVDKARDVSRLAVGESKRRTLERLGAAAQSLLDSFTVPAVAQILMVDAPAVLGTKLWQELRTEHILGYLVEALEWQMMQGTIEREPAAPLAHVLIGALTAAGLLIAYADDKLKARDEAGSAVLRLFMGLERR